MLEGCSWLGNIDINPATIQIQNTKLLTSIHLQVNISTLSVRSALQSEALPRKRLFTPRSSGLEEPYHRIRSAGNGLREWLAI